LIEHDESPSTAVRRDPALSVMRWVTQLIDWAGFNVSTNTV